MNTHPRIVEYRILARFRHRTCDCGTVAASTVAEAIEKARERKREWAAKALLCKPEQIVWEIEEDFT